MRRSLLCVLFGVLLGSAAVADQVTLKNGDRLTGTIVSADGKTLVMKSEYAGDVTIQWDAITAIESSQELHVTLKGGKQLAGKISTSDGTVAVAPGTAGGAAGSVPKDTITAVRNDADQKAYDEQEEKLAHPKIYYFWSGVFDSGLALTRGNSQTASYTLDGTAVRQTAREKITLFGTYILATDNTPLPGTTTPLSRTTANAITSGVRVDWNLSPRLFVFGLGNFATNELQHLDLRQVYGGGFGYHVIQTSSTLFDVFGGLTYDRDEFGAYALTNATPPPPTIPVAAVTKNSLEVLIGQEFDKKFGKKSVLNEHFSFYPNLSHGGEYRFLFNSTLATQIKNWFSWQFSLSDTYISYPPPGLKGNDLVLSTGVRANWGKPAKF